MTEGVALTLQQVADRLQLSYSTVFAMRQSIGFRMPGSRVWRVSPERLAELCKTNNNVTRLSLRVGGENECPSVKINVPVFGSLISARQAARELDDLLRQRTVKQPRNTTTG